MAEWELAQINIGRLVAPLDDPRIAGFVEQLDSINGMAERMTGFRWRLQSDAGNATDIVFSDDPFVIVNMSVWDSVESLRQFTYRLREHVQALRDRAQWFEKLALPHHCLWWVPAGHRPSVAERRQRLEHYQRHGPTPEAFWFGREFPEPVGEAVLSR